MMKRYLRLAWAALVLSLPAGLAGQQGRYRHVPPAHINVDSLVTKISSGRLGPMNGSVGAICILSQGYPGYSESDRARLHSALMGIALSDSVAAGPAIAVLASAGDSSATEPLPNAFADLSRLYRSAPSRAARRTALTLMAGLPDQTQVLNFWASVVLEPNPRDLIFPAVTVDLLAKSGSEEARALLQSLHSGGQVTNPDALHELERLAAKGFRF